MLADRFEDMYIRNSLFTVLPLQLPITPIGSTENKNVSYRKQIARQHSRFTLPKITARTGSW